MDKIQTSLEIQKIQKGLLSFVLFKLEQNLILVQVLIAMEN